MKMPFKLNHDSQIYLSSTISSPMGTREQHICKLSNRLLFRIYSLTGISSEVSYNVDSIGYSPYKYYNGNGYACIFIVPTLCFVYFHYVIIIREKMLIKMYTYQSLGISYTKYHVLSEI